MKNIKEKVLKEFEWKWKDKANAETHNKSLKDAINLTLAEVGKVIDNFPQYENDMGWTDKIKRELKKELGI